MNDLVAWPLEPGDSVRWWDGTRHRSGRYLGPVTRIIGRKAIPHARIEERVVTEEGTALRQRIVHPEALRPSNDGRTVRSRGFNVYIDKEDGSWLSTTPEPRPRRR